MNGLKRVSEQPQKGRWSPYSKFTVRQQKVYRGMGGGEPYHRMTINGVRKRTHIWMAERALGRVIKRPLCVHHMNEDHKSSAPVGLVICPDQGYHMLLHVRQRALDACGNANWLPCLFCKTYDAPENMVVSKSGAYHKPCRLDYLHTVKR